MSTVTLSNPHCAITSAENPEGIASQAFTTALPEPHTFLTLFATLFSFHFFHSRRHCEPTGRREAPPDDRLREAIHRRKNRLDCFVATLLAMTANYSTARCILISLTPTSRAVLTIA